MRRRRLTSVEVPKPVSIEASPFGLIPSLLRSEKGFIGRAYELGVKSESPPPSKIQKEPRHGERDGLRVTKDGTDFRVQERTPNTEGCPQTCWSSR